jgi:hypothetical protein
VKCNQEESERRLQKEKTHRYLRLEHKHFTLPDVNPDKNETSSYHSYTPNILMDVLSVVPLFNLLRNVVEKVTRLIFGLAHAPDSICNVQSEVKTITANIKLLQDYILYLLHGIEWALTLM